MNWITLGGWAVFVTYIRVMDEVILRETYYWDKRENQEYEINCFQNGNS